MSDTFSVQGSGTESLGFDFCVRVQDTHAPELPLPAETAEYFTGAPCPLMPALILHGALQEELSGDVCVCVGCVLMSHIFLVKTTVESCLMLFFLSLLLKTHNRYFQSQKCGCVFLFSSCVVHFPSPRNRVCTFHPWCTFHFQTVETCSRHSFAKHVEFGDHLTKTVIAPGINICLGWSDHKWEELKYRCDPMCLGPIIRCAGFVNGNRIQNKSFSLHNICMCTVFIYYVYINTHTLSIYFENIYMYIHLYYYIIYKIFNI